MFFGQDKTPARVGYDPRQFDANQPPIRLENEPALTYQRRRGNSGVRNSGRGAAQQTSALRLTARFLVLSMFLVLGACDSLLDVELPTRIPAAVLDNPALAQTLSLGVQNEFECAYSNYVAGSGLFVDELWASTEFFGYNQIDSRQITSGLANTGDCAAGNLFHIFLPIYRANWVAQDVAERLSAFSTDEVPRRDEFIATAMLYSGFTTTLLAEGYCQAVVEEEGPALDPPDVFRAAEARFSEAITLAQSAGFQGLLDAARVGRARVRLGLGDTDGASNDASAVPEGFRMDATYSTASALRENQLQVTMFRDQFVSVEPPYWDLEVGGMPDPRVDLDMKGGALGPDGATPYVVANKYAEGPEAPIRLASWEEAQLIIAEAQLGQAAVDAINAVRATHGLPPYVPVNVNDGNEILAQVIEERRREFFLEGHWLGDKRRHDIPFKTENHKDQTVGSRTCFPLPQREADNNPNAG